MNLLIHYLRPTRVTPILEDVVLRSVVDASCVHTSEIQPGHDV